MMTELEKLMEANKDVLIRLKNDTPKPFGHIHCPAFDMTCPYCLASGECTIDNPKEECEEYWYYNQEEEE